MIIQKSKMVLLFAILIVSLFALITNKSEAQCPTGYTFTNMTINVNGCVYSVNVCYKCSPMGLYLTDVLPIGNLTKVDPSCTQTWPHTQVIAALLQGIRNRIFLLGLCEIRPCGLNPPATMNFPEYACWSVDASGSYNACTSEPYCNVLYEACRDDNANPPVIWTVISGSWVGGTPSCPAPPVPPITWTTGTCYLYKANCP